ncbi:unnamed protein product, partial [Trichogramma brassicae]
HTKEAAASVDILLYTLPAKVYRDTGTLGLLRKAWFGRHAANTCAVLFKNIIADLGHTHATYILDVAQVSARLHIVLLKVWHSLIKIIRAISAPDVKFGPYLGHKKIFLRGIFISRARVKATPEKPVAIIDAEARVKHDLREPVTSKLLPGSLYSHKMSSCASAQRHTNIWFNFLMKSSRKIHEIKSKRSRFYIHFRKMHRRKSVPDEGIHFSIIRARGELVCESCLAQLLSLLADVPQAAPTRIQMIRCKLCCARESERLPWRRRRRLGYLHELICMRRSGWTRRSSSLGGLRLVCTVPVLLIFTASLLLRLHGIIVYVAQQQQQQQQQQRNLHTNSRARRERYNTRFVRERDRESPSRRAYISSSVLCSLKFHESTSFTTKLNSPERARRKKSKYSIGILHIPRPPRANTNARAYITQRPARTRRKCGGPARVSKILAAPARRRTNRPEGDLEQERGKKKKRVKKNESHIALDAGERISPRVSGLLRRTRELQRIAVREKKEKETFRRFGFPYQYPRSTTSTRQERFARYYLARHNEIYRERYSPSSGGCSDINIVLKVINKPDANEFTRVRVFTYRSAAVVPLLASQLAGLRRPYNHRTLSERSTIIPTRLSARSSRWTGSSCGSEDHHAARRCSDSHIAKHIGAAAASPCSSANDTCVCLRPDLLV